MVHVLKSGLFSTIQDLGRFGQRKFGVPVSGCMDKFSFELANQVLQNDPNDAMMEITMLGPKLLFEVNTQIVITGALLEPKLNEIPISNNKIYMVKTGDILSFGKLNSGFRAYLAVKGGFKTDSIFGSRSYFKPITKNAKIEKGNILPIKEFTGDMKVSQQFSAVKPFDFLNPILQVFKGPEFCMIPTSIEKQLLNNTFNISNLYNRMAYQLNPNLENDLPSILTSAVLPGSVQLTPSGKLIVLMRDCQTTGGYPRVLQLTEHAINSLSQKKENDKVSFQIVK